MRTYLMIQSLVIVIAMTATVFAVDPAFKAPVEYTVGTNPQSVVSADFNADGKQDIASVNSLSNSVSILLNNGDGTYAAAVNYPVGTYPTSACIIDVDDDLRPDIAVTNFSSSTISILFNLGPGTFDVAVEYSTGTQPTSICRGDFNADNKMDLATANSGSGDISILLNFNNSKFPTFVSYATGIAPAGICSADFNSDGKKDIAVANSGDNNVSTLRGNGDGTFQAAVQHSVGLSPTSVCTSDFNGNGTFDLAIANSGANTVSVMLNSGAGVFASPVDYTVGNFPIHIVASDLDNDGKEEIIAADQTADSISVLHNNGNGTFGTVVNHLVGFGPTSVTSADFNADGTKDVAVSNGTSNSVSVLMSTRQFKITATSGANGAIFPSGIVNVLDSSSQAFTITPNVGYHIANVLVDGSSVGPVTSHNFTVVTANHTISCSFAINQFTTTATAGPNGTITPSGSVVGNYGTVQSFSIAPNIGYHIVDVLVDGVSQGAVAAWTFPFLDADHTVAASFAINTYLLTASSGANGSVTPVGVTLVNYGAGQTYTITPNPCYHVQDVLVDGGSVGAVTNYPFTSVADNHTISAAFALNVYTITAAAGPHGSIAPAGAVSADCGSDRSFLITPDLNYHIADVLVDGLSVGPVSALSITNVTNDHSVTASFACCIGSRGNVNGSVGDGVNVVDITFLVQYLFKGGTTPPCKEEADMSVNNSVNVVDLTTLVNFLFRGGPPMPACP